MRETELLRQSEGWYYGFTKEKDIFLNYFQPENPKNKEWMKNILTLDLNISEKYNVSLYLEQYLKYARCVILNSMLSKIAAKEEEIKESTAKYSIIQNDILDILKTLEKEERVFSLISLISKYYDVLDKGFEHQPGMF